MSEPGRVDPEPCGAVNDNRPWLGCPRCTYDLSGTIMQSSICPECGVDVRLWAPPEQHRRNLFDGLTPTKRRLLYWSPAPGWAIGNHLMMHNFALSALGLLVMLVSMTWAGYILSAWARWISIAHPEDLMYGRWTAFFFAIVQNGIVRIIGAGVLAALIMVIA
ncbi:MAG: hypothetical protein AAGI30_04040 [Planctomycetota bacterium]